MADEIPTGPNLQCVYRLPIGSQSQVSHVPLRGVDPQSELGIYVLHRSFEYRSIFDRRYENSAFLSSRFGTHLFHTAKFC